MKTLTIEFGGLCLFGIRDRDAVRGRFVLMPNMTMDKVMPHWPMMIIPTVVYGKAALYPLLGQWIDLTGLEQYLANGADPTFEWALDVSDYAGKRKVSDQWLTDPPSDKLACRVMLPPRAPVVGDGPSATIAVDEHGARGAARLVQVKGRAIVKMELDKYTEEFLQLGPATIDARYDNIKVYIVNIPRCDVTRRLPRPHFVGQRLPHQDSYYGLLESTLKQTPRFWVAGELPTKTDNSPCTQADGPGAPELVDFVEPDISIEWVDTHDCTIGTGT